MKFLPFAVLLFALTGFLIKRFRDLGVGSTVQNEWNIPEDNCHKEAYGLLGIEDIVVNQEKEIAYLSVSNRRVSLIAQKEDPS